jgi:hypothetical protein
MTLKKAVESTQRRKGAETQRGWRRKLRNLTAENAKNAEGESILFVLSAFSAVKSFRQESCFLSPCASPLRPCRLASLR